MKKGGLAVKKCGASPRKPWIYIICRADGTCLIGYHWGHTGHTQQRREEIGYLVGHVTYCHLETHHQSMDTTIIWMGVSKNDGVTPTRMGISLISWLISLTWWHFMGDITWYNQPTIDMWFQKRAIPQYMANKTTIWKTRIRQWRSFHVYLICIYRWSSHEKKETSFGSVQKRGIRDTPIYGDFCVEKIVAVVGELMFVMIVL